MLKNLPPLAPFRPRLLNDLKGYNSEKLAKDMGAGATVGIVAGLHALQGFLPAFFVN